jgi:hypothetical protein
VAELEYIEGVQRNPPNLNFAFWMPLVFFFTTSPKDPNRFHFTYFLNPLDHGPGYATRRGVFLTTAIGNRHGGTISLIGVFVWQIFGLPLSTTLDMCMIFYFCLKWKFLMFHAIHNFFIFSFQVSFRFYVCIASVTQILNFFIIIFIQIKPLKTSLCGMY